MSFELPNATRSLIGALLLMVGLLIAPHAASAQATIIAPGDSAVLLRTDKPVAEVKASVGTAGSVVQDKTNILVFVAPEKSGDVDTTVTYKLDGALVAVPVSIRAQAPTLTDPQFYNASFRAVFALFILAVIVESGLALIFRWPPFLDFFDGRSVNSIVAFGFSLMFVCLFNLDIATTLVNIYSRTNFPWSWPGLILTALIIAGGSAGVNRILQTFGFRPVGGSQLPPPSPPDNEAWIAVSLVRDRAVGPVMVQIGVGNAVAAAGTIRGASHNSGVLHYFLRDKGRFPQSGGYRVAPGEYTIHLVGTNSAGQALEPVTWGPQAIGNRALVDVQLKL